MIPDQNLGSSVLVGYDVDVIHSLLAEATS